MYSQSSRMIDNCGRGGEEAVVGDMHEATRSRPTGGARKSVPEPGVD